MSKKTKFSFLVLMKFVFLNVEEKRKIVEILKKVLTIWKI